MGTLQVIKICDTIAVKQQLNIDHPLTPASNKIPVIIPRIGLLHILMIGGEGRHGIFFHDQSLQLLDNICMVL